MLGVLVSIYKENLGIYYLFESGKKCKKFFLTIEMFASIFDFVFSHWYFVKIRESGLPGFNNSLNYLLQKMQNSLDVVNFFRSANYGALIFSQQWSCLVQYIGNIWNSFFY